MAIFGSKVVLFGHTGCTRAEVVVFGLKLLYSDKRCCFWAKWLNSGESGCAKVVVLGQRCCIRAKVLYSGESFCILAKWLYSGKIFGIRVKVVVFGQKLLISGTVVVFGQKWL